MAETIESFVQKLQQEGIQAGQQEAQRLRQDAQQQAKQIIDQANAQAQRIVQQAKAQARQDLDRGRTELQLACRDAILRLRDSLQKALAIVLSRQVEAQLSDPKFLTAALHELLRLYSQADLEHRSFELNVSPQLLQKLSEWALKELGDAERHGMVLHGTLKQAGFEYRADGATIEVTRDSVVAILLELVGPRLRELIEQAETPKAQET